MWNDFLTQLTPQMWQAVWVSTYETVYISFASTLLAVLIGLPFGVVTFLTGKGEILQNARLNLILNIVINIGRSIPFIILLIILLPFTRFILNTTLGTTAAIIPLSILTSQIENAGGVKFGFTVAEVEGDEDAITQTKIYLMENNVRVEVLGYVE